MTLAGKVIDKKEDLQVYRKRITEETRTGKKGTTWRIH